MRLLITGGEGRLARRLVPELVREQMGRMVADLLANRADVYKDDESGQFEQVDVPKETQAAAAQISYPATPVAAAAANKGAGASSWTAVRRSAPLCCAERRAPNGSPW